MKKENEGVKKLPKEFTGKGVVKGNQFKQVLKNGKAYVYEVTQPGVEKKHYEVFKRKVFKPENREIYPSAKSFSKWAWTFPTMEKAFQKMVVISD